MLPVPIAQQFHQLAVHVGGVGLVAGDHLELAAPQAGGDLQRRRNRAGAARRRAASRPGPTPAARTSARCPGGRSFGRRWLPGRRGICTAVGHIGCSSRGGPGSTTTVGLPGTTTPGAVPTGSITTRPDRDHGLLAVGGAHRIEIAAPDARPSDFFKIAAILFSSSASSTSSRPQNRATVATVISSAVGPRPPLVTIRSTPSAARKRSCASMSAARSPQMVMWASSTPSSRSRSAIHGPLRSATRPVNTSVPVTTMPARALTAMTLGVARRMDR